MKTAMTVLAIAALCICAWAADNAGVGARPIANHQSPISERQSLDAITIPQMLSYQGKLTDTAGMPVADTTYSVIFKLYTAPAGGSSFWNETQIVRTRGGLFSTLLGSVTPIASMPDAGAAYLGMAVAGGSELTPRLRLASSAYAYLSARAANADLVQGKDTTALDARYVNEGQANSITSAMITDGSVTSADIRDTTVNTTELKDGAVTSAKILNATIAAADLNQMGATNNQVLKWTGSAWAPRNDSVGGGGGGGTVTSVSQATGIVCTPNPITTTGTVRLDTVYGDGRYIRNQSSSGQSANLWITGFGRAAQFTGEAASSGRPAIQGYGGKYGAGVYGSCDTFLSAGVYGSGGTKTSGVHGYAESYSSFGVRAQNDDVHGTAVLGVGNGLQGSMLSQGSGAAFTGDTCGSFSIAKDTFGTGVIGCGNNYAVVITHPSGSGGSFAGKVCGAYGSAANSSGATYGVSGRASSSSGFAVYGLNTNSTGTGMMGVGNNRAGLSPGPGSGGAFTGSTFGVAGYALDTAGCRGGYFDNGKGTYAHVACYAGGVQYKIVGSGTVSTVMGTRQGSKALFAPEMPEAFFEDCGEGQLSSGHCRVNLEKLFSDCITVNTEHPLRVFVQLEDDCKGVYVNKDATGFDVRELQGGMSNARFSWRVLARWKGYEGVRLPEAPGRAPSFQVKPEESVTGEVTRVAAPVAAGAIQVAVPVTK